MRGAFGAAVLALILCIGSVCAQYGDNGFVNTPSSSAWSSETYAAQEHWSKLINETGGVLALHEALVVRFTGTSVVPFTLETQEILTQAFEEVVVPALGPVQIVSYRESYPKPGYSDPWGSTEPYVDFAGNLYHLFNRSMPNLNVSDTWTQAWTDEFTVFLMWGAKAQSLGLNATVSLMSININEMVLTHSVDLYPVVPVEVLVEVGTDDGSALTATQASAVAEELATLTGAYVDVMAWHSSAALVFLDMATETATDAQLMVLDISLPACPGKNSSTWQTCALGTLRLQLLEVFATPELSSRLADVNITSLSVAGLRLRPTPDAPVVATSGPNGLTTWGNGTAGNADTPVPSPPPSVPSTPADESGSASSAPLTSVGYQQALKAEATTVPLSTANATVPWHLDRLDQRVLPLDGEYTATGDGSGVNVYILSSGVDATHPEFAWPDGTPGSRIKAGWGYNGTDPLQDCPDAFAWYGFGTFAASMIGGNTLGVARNATMTSVRFRSSCMLESPNIWAPGGLPSAIDGVLSTAVAPAVMIIDTWWSPNRFSSDDDAWIAQALNSRLDQAAAANITVVVPAGFGDANVCDNVLAAHPATIAVAAVDDFDRLTIFGASNSSCIDVWGPGGGLGVGVLGAQAGGGYVSVITRAFGAAWVVTGIAAQYLSANPNATGVEVQQALQGMASSDQLLQIGTQSPNLMAYTDMQSNVTSGGSTTTAPASSGSSSALSAGAVAGLAVGVAAAVALATMAVFAVIVRRRRAARTAAAPGSLAGDGEWEIDESRIEIARRSDDGALWQLGEGSYGKVYKAVKDGVQVVAVKTVRCDGNAPRDQFVREIAMMRFVSRDPNVVQFYGAVVGAKSLMLVFEYMEGGDLRKALTADIKRRLTWRAGGKAIALDITRGLHFLHTSRVSHRDIKSSNVLLTREGRAKLGDVGLARILEEQQQSDGFVGTFAWAAPELLMGQPCDERVDIWSLGTVLWEIVTQEMPMRGMLRPPVVPEECPQEVVDVMHACMAHDPRDRPSARQVYNMLLAAPPLAGYEDVMRLAGDGSAGSPGSSDPGSNSPPDSAASSGPLQAMLPSPRGMISDNPFYLAVAGSGSSAEGAVGNGGRAAPPHSAAQHWVAAAESKPAPVAAPSAATGSGLDIGSGLGTKSPGGNGAFDSAMQVTSRTTGAVKRVMSPKLHAIVTQIQQRLRHHAAANTGASTSGSSPVLSSDKSESLPSKHDTPRGPHDIV